MSDKIINLTDPALKALVKEMIDWVKSQGKSLDDWVDGEEAMRLLRITSPTTLQKWRKEGKIRYSQPEKRIILYERASIMAFIEKHAKDTF